MKMGWEMPKILKHAAVAGSVAGIIAGGMKEAKAGEIPHHPEKIKGDGSEISFVQEVKHMPKKNSVSNEVLENVTTERLRGVDDNKDEFPEENFFKNVDENGNVQTRSIEQNN